MIEGISLLIMLYFLLKSMKYASSYRMHTAALYYLVFGYIFAETFTQFCWYVWSVVKAML